MNFQRAAFWTLMVVGGWAWTIALRSLAQVMGCLS